MVDFIVAAAIGAIGFLVMEFLNAPVMEEDEMQQTYDGKTVYCYRIVAHDGTRIHVWAENVLQAEAFFVRSKWGKKPWQTIGAESECGGR